MCAASERRTLLRVLVCAACVLGGCERPDAPTELGSGGSAIAGSGGPAGAQNAARELVTCREPVGVVALVENRRGYMGLGRGGLPSSPLPLIRVLMQQSGCFRVVDRQAGLQQAVREQELRDQGVLRSDRAGSVARGRGFMAQYSLLPSLTFSEQEAGRGIGGVLTDLGEATGAAPAVKFKEAQVVLLLTDNETTEQVAAATGSARTSDFGIGALVFGDRGVQVGLGWSNTNEGKVIAAAILDAYNQLVRQLQAMTPKELPVATEGLRPLPGR